MSKDDAQPLVSMSGIITDLILTVVFFLFMTYVLGPHVPSQDPTTIKVVSGMTALCMSGVFWIAANMFRVTRVDYQRRKKTNN